MIPIRADSFTMKCCICVSFRTKTFFLALSIKMNSNGSGTQEVVRRSIIQDYIRQEISLDYELADGASRQILTSNPLSGATLSPTGQRTCTIKIPAQKGLWYDGQEAYISAVMAITAGTGSDVAYLSDALLSTVIQYRVYTDDLEYENFSQYNRQECQRQRATMDQTYRTGPGQIMRTITDTSSDNVVSTIGSSRRVLMCFPYESLLTKKIPLHKDIYVEFTIASSLAECIYASAVGTASLEISNIRLQYAVVKDPLLNVLLEHPFSVHTIGYKAFTESMADSSTSFQLRANVPVHDLVGINSYMVDSDLYKAVTWFNKYQQTLFNGSTSYYYDILNYRFPQSRDVDCTNGCESIVHHLSLFDHNEIPDGDRSFAPNVYDYGYSATGDSDGFVCAIDTRISHNSHSGLDISSGGGAITLNWQGSANEHSIWVMFVYYLRKFTFLPNGAVQIYE